MRVENVQDRIVYRTSLVIGVAYLGFLLSYVLNGVLARTFHVAEYGDIKFGLSIVGTLSFVIILGHGVVTKKVYPVFVKHQDEAKQTEYRSWAFSLVFKSSIVLWVIFIVALMILIFFEPNVWEKIGGYHVAIWFIAIAPVFAASSLVSSFMYAVNRGVLNKFLVSNVLVILITAALLLLSSLLEGDLKQYHVVFIYLACYLLIVVFQYRYILTFSSNITIKPMVFFNHPSSHQRQWLSDGISYLCSNIMFLLLLSLDLIILELVSLVVPGIHDEGEVGLYAAACAAANWASSSGKTPYCNSDIFARSPARFADSMSILACSKASLIC